MGAGRGKRKVLPSCKNLGGKGGKKERSGEKKAAVRNFPKIVDGRTPSRRTKEKSGKKGDSLGPGVYSGRKGRR